MLRHGDVSDWHACCNQDSTVGCAQVDVRFACYRIAGDHVIEVKTGLLEGLDYLITHLETLLTDTGSHRCLNAFGTCALMAHFLDHGLGNAPYRATPSGMGNGDDSSLFIDQHDGYAIGGIHTDDYALQLCHQCVHALQGLFLLVDIQ